MAVTRRKQLPHPWDSETDATACAVCMREFADGDTVLTDTAVTVHVGCVEVYRRQLVELGLAKEAT